MYGNTGSASSKNEHRRKSAMLRNIWNIRICVGKIPIVSVTYKNERISIKKLLTLHKMCVTSLLCDPWAHLWPFYGLYWKRFSLSIKVYQGWILQRSGPVSAQTDKNWKTSLKEITFLWQLIRGVWAPIGNGSSLSGVLCLIVTLVCL